MDGEHSATEVAVDFWFNLPKMFINMLSSYLNDEGIA